MALDKSFYEIIEIAHNQFKIKIDNLRSSLFLRRSKKQRKQLIIIFLFLRIWKIWKVRYLKQQNITIFIMRLVILFQILFLFSYQIGKRFQSISFQNHVIDSIIEESPAHVFVNVRWLNYEEIIWLEKAYADYRNCELAELDLKEKKLETLLLFIMKDE